MGEWSRRWRGCLILCCSFQQLVKAAHGLYSEKNRATGHKGRYTGQSVPCRGLFVFENRIQMFVRFK